MIERTIMNDLLSWMDNSKLPLILTGARQTGKTFILSYFCEKYFEDFVYLNLEKDPDLIQFFESSLDPKHIVKQIELYMQRTIDVDNTIIFIDEIQISEKAITSLKYFAESTNQYKIVCAGSLLGVKLNRFNSSFPVGKVVMKHLYPITFDEFLNATNNKRLKDEIERCYNDNSPMLDVFHERCIELYRNYLYIGGMPQAVNNFIENEFNISKFDRSIHQNLISAYLADMTKYTTGSESIKVNRIYNSLPSQLAKDNPKFVYKLVEGTKLENRNARSSIDWLIDSSIVLNSVLISKPSTPLQAYEQHNMFKLFYSDCGILCSHSNISADEILFNTLGMFGGNLTENYVACCLKANGYNLNYWVSNSQAEIDFVIRTNDGIIPIEVKNSTNVRSKSLDSYIKKYKPLYGIRVSLKNFGYENNIKSVPLYAAYLI